MIWRSSKTAWCRQIRIYTSGSVLHALSLRLANLIPGILYRGFLGGGFSSLSLSPPPNVRFTLSTVNERRARFWTLGRYCVSQHRGGDIYVAFRGAGTDKTRPLEGSPLFNPHHHPAHRPPHSYRAGHPNRRTGTPHRGARPQAARRAVPPRNTAANAGSFGGGTNVKKKKNSLRAFIFFFFIHPVVLPWLR